MAFLGFKTAKEKDEMRKKKLEALVTEQQKPPSSAKKIEVYQETKKAGRRTGDEISRIWEKSLTQQKKKKAK